MIELILAVLLATLATVERLHTGRRWDEERRRLLGIIVAQDVSPQAAVAAAVKSEKPKPERNQRLTPVDL